VRVPKGAPASVSRLLKTDLEELLSGKVNNMLLLHRHPETGLSSLRFKCDCCGKLIDEAHGTLSDGVQTEYLCVSFNGFGIEQMLAIMEWMEEQR
jgi:hypothetical protein